jgi:hypothetical protein
MAQPGYDCTDPTLICTILTSMDSGYWFNVFLGERSEMQNVLVSTLGFRPLILVLVPQIQGLLS